MVMCGSFGLLDGPSPVGTGEESETRTGLLSSCCSESNDAPSKTVQELKITPTSESVSAMSSSSESSSSSTKESSVETSSGTSFTTGTCCTTALNSETCKPFSVESKTGLPSIVESILMSNQGCVVETIPMPTTVDTGIILKTITQEMEKMDGESGSKTMREENVESIEVGNCGFVEKDLESLKILKWIIFVLIVLNTIGTVAAAPAPRIGLVVGCACCKKDNVRQRKSMDAEREKLPPPDTDTQYQ